MPNYSYTKSRVLQWLGIIAILCLFGGAYWYFQVRASTLNQSRNDLVSSGLVLLWSFNGDDITSGTTAVDRSATGANGTLTNGPTKVGGRIGQALDFDGTDDYVTTADNSALDVGTSTDVALSGWFSRESFTTDDTIIAKRSGITAGDTGYILYIDDATDQLIFEVSDGTDEYSLTSISTFTTAGWNHFVVVWDQDSAPGSELFINGVANTATDAGTIGNIDDLSNAVAFRVGAESDAGNPFDGKLDEIREYNRTLSTGEIQSLYDQGGGTRVNSSVSNAQGSGRLDSGLAGYWRLDDGSGTSATDSSSGGNTGSPTSGGYTGTTPNAGMGFQLQNPLNVSTICGLIKKVLNVILGLGIPVAMLFVVYSGFLFVVARGNPAKLKEARLNLVHVIFGIALFLGAWLLGQLVANTINSINPGTVTATNSCV
jgi:hypothetical protein